MPKKKTSKKKQNNHPSISSAKYRFRVIGGRGSSYKDGNLSFDEFYKLSQMNCFYCDSKPSNIINRFKWDYKYSGNKNMSKKSAQSIKDGNFIYNGLDRVNPDLPHNKDNVVPCCKTCNYAKNNMTTKEFRAWIKKIYKHFIKK